MKKSSPLRLMSPRSTLRKATVVLSALTFGLSGCTSHPSTPQQQEQQAPEELVSANFSIREADITGASTHSGRSLSALSLEHAQSFSFADVASLRITVTDKLTSTPLYRNFDLFFSAGDWTGSLPFLPKGKALVFSAEARDSTGTLLFQGSTDQTLATSGQSIVIRLTAANDGKSYPIPRIKQISVPSAFSSEQTGNVSFFVEATTGEKLTYEITPSVPGSGGFTPTNGTITLKGTAGTFVSQYTAPVVSANAEYEFTVKVTNESGNSVLTTFKTQVKPTGTTEGVNDNTIQVFFSPVINSVSTSRQLGTGNVLFQAEVADSDDASTLSYAWSFAPTPGMSFSPAPVFSDTTNPATLQNYTTAVQGIISFQVTDSHGGKTTLSYPLNINQFPDNPVVEGGMTGINSIRAGESHTCALFNSGSVRCWGRGTWGQLGYGNTHDIGDNELPYTAGDVPLEGVGARLAVGGNHTCALLDTGLVRCWGSNTYGQLGYNTTESVGDGEAIASYGYVNLGGIAVKLAAGYEHTCALMNTGKVRCWGRGSQGQLGYGNSDNVGDNEQPFSVGDVDLGDGVVVKDITAGGAHTCALLDTGKVRCWGYNYYGQLGTGDYKNVGDNELPSSIGDVDVGGTVKQLSAGRNHTCALLDTGNVRCWGYNGYGQLGYGHYVNVTSPTSASPQAGDVDVGDRVFQVSAGDSHTCVLLASGSVKCWGNGASGRLGYGNTNSLSAPSAATEDLSGASAFQVEAGSGHTCVLLSTGAARCWGLNNFGQLGYSNINNIGDTELASAPGDIQVLAP